MIKIFNLNLTFFQFIIIIYLLVINLTTFFIFTYDKIIAGGIHRRISEKMLWFLALMGGSVGALLSMYWFRHKTKKLSFQAVLAIVIGVQIFLLYFLLH